MIDFTKEAGARRPPLPEFWAEVNRQGVIMWAKTDDGAFWWSDGVLIERMDRAPGTGRENAGVKVFIERYRERRAVPMQGPEEVADPAQLRFVYGAWWTVSLARTYAEYAAIQGYSFGALLHAKEQFPLVGLYRGAEFVGLVCPLGNRPHTYRIAEAEVTPQ